MVALELDGRDCGIGNGLNTESQAVKGSESSAGRGLVTVLPTKFKTPVIGWS